MGDADNTPAWLEDPAGRKIPLNGNFSIGRAAPASLLLQDSNVSRRHAVIHVQDGGEFWLVDLGSINGSYVNDRRLQVPVKLNAGDRIGIGESLFTFHQCSTPVPETQPHPTVQVTMANVQNMRCWLLLTDMIGFSRLSQSLDTVQLTQAVGRWVADWKNVIEKHEGIINKYLGDGIFAYWRDSPTVPKTLTCVIADLRALQGPKSPPFRFVMHYGHVMLGGAGSPGEESMLGPDVNFVFRMERLASSLGTPRLFSEAAQKRLPNLQNASRLPATHEIKGTPGKHAFFTT